MHGTQKVVSMNVWFGLADTTAQSKP